MPKKIVSNSFVSGEISPELYGRHDLKAYFNGAAKIENFVVRRTGGIRKRSGTTVIHSINTAQETGRDVRIFAYYYDSSVYGILAMRIHPENGLQCKLVIFADDRTDTTDWTYPTPYGNTGIDTAEKLNTLRAVQVGDTIFFTLKGTRSFLCQINRQELSMSFLPIHNEMDIQSPSPINATPKDFNTSTNKKTKKTYALYGVSGGRISPPTTKTVDATTPWTAGATITVTGQLDFSKYDHYILAKKTGVNYGKLSEIYRAELIKQIAPSLVSSDQPGFYPVNYSSPNKNAFLDGTFDRLASSRRIFSMSKYALGFKTYKSSWMHHCSFTTPIFLIDFGESEDHTLEICFKLDLIDSSLERKTISLPQGHLVSIYPFWFEPDLTTTLTGTGWEIPGYTIAGYNSYIDENGVASNDLWEYELTGKKYIGFAIDTNDYDPDVVNAVFISSLRIKDTITGEERMAEECLLEIPNTVPGNALQPDVADISLKCKPVLYGKTFGEDKTMFANWNKVTPLGIYGNTDEYGQRFEDARDLVRDNQAIANSADFHITASRMSTATLKMPEGITTINSIVLYVGAKTFNSTTGENAPDTVRDVTMRLIMLDGGTEHRVLERTIQAGVVAQHEFNIEYLTPKRSRDYKITFSENVYVRGITFKTEEADFTFVDDNIIPGPIVSAQEMLVVGDTGMDCHLYDVFQQRSVFASSNELPFTLWFSSVGDLYNFYTDRPQSDDNAFSITIPAKRASKIMSIIAGKDLMLFTEDGVYKADTDSNVGFSFRSVRLSKVCSSASSERVDPIEIDTKILYCGEDNRTILELSYSLMEDRIVPTNRTIQAYHLTENSRVVKMVYQRYPDSVLWCLLEDGSIIGLTYIPEHEVWAWHRHKFEETKDKRKLIDIIDTGATNSKSGFETSSVILLVFKTDGDNPTYHIETLNPDIAADEYTNGDDAKCIDHKGAGGDNQVPVKATLITNRPETEETNTQGVPKRVVDVSLRVRRAGEISVKPCEPTLPAMSTNKSKTDGTKLTLYSGDIKIMPRGYINGDGQIQIESDDNLPCEILSAVYTMDSP